MGNLYRKKKTPYYRGTRPRCAGDKVAKIQVLLFLPYVIESESGKESEVSKRGWREGVGDQQHPKHSKNASQSGVLLLIRGHREKRTEKRLEFMVWEGSPCANPVCPPTPFRNF